MKQTKRILASLLCVILLFSVFAVMSAAEDKDYYSFSDADPETLDMIYNPSNYEREFELDGLMVTLNKGKAVDKDDLLGSAQRLLPEVTLTNVRDLTNYNSTTDPNLKRVILSISFEERTKQGVIDLIDALKYNPNVSYSRPNYRYYAADETPLNIGNPLENRYVGGKMCVVVTVPYGDQIEDKVDHFELLNESGAKIKIIETAMELFDKAPIFPGVIGYQGYGKNADFSESNRFAVFCLYFTVLTPSKENEVRTFTLRAITESGEPYESDIYTNFSYTVRPEANAKAVRSASFESETVEKGQPVLATVSTGSQVKSINIYNEKNAKMGKSLISKTQNPDGSRDWTYSMTIGTAGENRTFTAIADGDAETATAMSITVTK